MGLSDGAFFMIKHTPLPNGNHPISSPVCPMGVADTLEPCPSTTLVRVMCLLLCACWIERDDRFSAVPPTEL